MCRRATMQLQDTNKDIAMDTRRQRRQVEFMLKTACPASHRHADDQAEEDGPTLHRDPSAALIAVFLYCMICFGKDCIKFGITAGEAHARDGNASTYYGDFFSAYFRTPVTTRLCARVQCGSAGDGTHSTAQRTQTCRVRRRILRRGFGSRSLCLCMSRVFRDWAPPPPPSQERARMPTQKPTAHDVKKVTMAPKFTLYEDVIKLIFIAFLTVGRELIAMWVADGQCLAVIVYVMIQHVASIPPYRLMLAFKALIEHQAQHPEWNRTVDRIWDFFEAGGMYTFLPGVSADELRAVAHNLRAISAEWRGRERDIGWQQLCTSGAGGAGVVTCLTPAQGAAAADAIMEQPLVSAGFKHMRPHTTGNKRHRQTEDEVSSQEPSSEAHEDYLALLLERARCLDIADPDQHR